MKNRKFFTGAALVASLATLGVVQGYLDKVAAQAKQVPRFEVDPNRGTCFACAATLSR